MIDISKLNPEFIVIQCNSFHGEFSYILIGSDEILNIVRHCEKFESIDEEVVCESLGIAEIDEIKDEEMKYEIKAAIDLDLEFEFFTLEEIVQNNKECCEDLLIEAGFVETLDENDIDVIRLFEGDRSLLKSCLIKIFDTGFSNGFIADQLRLQENNFPVLYASP